MQLQENKCIQHFAFIAKVKLGRGKNIREKELDGLKCHGKSFDRLLRPLTIHYARWILFDNDTRFIYYASFDTDLDKYLDDAARLFAESGIAGFFPDLEGFPESRTRLVQATQRLTGSFWRITGWKATPKFEGYPGVTVEEIKKALRVRNAFSNMLDEMQ